MEEKYFKDAYKRAYDKITPDKDCVGRLITRASERPKHSMVFGVVRPVAMALAVICVLGVLSLPSVAREHPRIYSLIAKYAPALMDYVLPTQISSTSQGLTMQIEAIKVEDKTAEIILSFTDADDDSNRIDGEIDILEQYYFESYGTVYNIGGHSFLEYDETEDKAYFKVQLTTMSEETPGGKMTFGVYQLLTNCREYTQWIDLRDMVMEPPTKWVTIHGRAGSGGEFFEKYTGRAMSEDCPLPTANVMEVPQITDTDLGESLTVTGIGYADGVLRVQLCRGNLDNADRHMRLYLVDSDGEEQIPDLGVSWKEEINGESLTFDETWFRVEESELENLQMYGIYSVTDGSVEGEWKVTFKVQPFSAM